MGHSFSLCTRSLPHKQKRYFIAEETPNKPRVDVDIDTATDKVRWLFSFALTFFFITSRCTMDHPGP